MIETDHITKIKSNGKVAGLKKNTAVAPVAPRGVEAVDKLTLTSGAKEAIELDRFVDMLRKMPDVREAYLEKEFDFSAAGILKEVARKISENL